MRTPRMHSSPAIARALAVAIILAPLMPFPDGFGLAPVLQASGPRTAAHRDAPWTPANGSNLLQNGDFESGIAPWTTYHATLGITTTAHSGSAALAVGPWTAFGGLYYIANYANDNPWGNVPYGVVAPQTGIYTATAWVLGVPGQPDEPQQELELDIHTGTATSGIAQRSSGVLADGAWQQLSVSVFATAGVTIDVWVGQYNYSAGDSFVLDDVSLVPPGTPVATDTPAASLPTATATTLPSTPTASATTPAAPACATSTANPPSGQACDTLTPAPSATATMPVLPPATPIAQTTTSPRPSATSTVAPTATASPATVPAASSITSSSGTASATPTSIQTVIPTVTTTATGTPTRAGGQAPAPTATSVKSGASPSDSSSSIQLIVVAPWHTSTWRSGPSPAVPALRVTLSSTALRPGMWLFVRVRYARRSSVRAALIYAPRRQLVIAGHTDGRGNVSLRIHVPPVPGARVSRAAVLSVSAWSGHFRARRDMHIPWLTGHAGSQNRPSINTDEKRAARPDELTGPHPDAPTCTC